MQPGILNFGHDDHVLTEAKHEADRARRNIFHILAAGLLLVFRGITSGPLVEKNLRKCFTTPRSLILRSPGDYKPRVGCVGGVRASFPRRKDGKQQPQQQR